MLNYLKLQTIFSERAFLAIVAETYESSKTETGGILISPQPGAVDLKPGSATKPFYGIVPVIVDVPEPI